MKPSTRTVLSAAMVFAFAMGTLEQGGWWWAWLGGVVWALTGFRRPRLTRLLKFLLANLVKFFRACREKAKDHRARQRLAHQQRRAAKRHQ